MSNPAPPPNARPLIERQIAILGRLAEIGLDLAEAAGAQARAPERDPDIPDPALTYARAARAVRMSIALQSRLLEDLARLDRDEALVRTARIDRRRDQIHDLVHQAVTVEHDDYRVVRHLTREARERLLDEDEFPDLLDLPVEAVVARICRDLGLSMDWLTQDDPEPDDPEPDRSSFSPPGETAGMELPDEGAGPERPPPHHRIN